MAHSHHPTYAAADRYARRMERKPRPTERRQSTRRAVVLAAIREA